MKMLHQDIFEELMSEQEINDTVDKIAAQINRDYAGKSVIVVGVLKGSIMFLADLLRKLTIDDCQLDFVAASSYSSGSVSSGKVKITKDITCNPIGRDILLVEDILDTGNTLSYIKDHLMKMGAVRFVYSRVR